jgi:hypothetical protein
MSCVGLVSSMGDKYIHMETPEDKGVDWRIILKRILNK